MFHFGGDTSTTGCGIKSSISRGSQSSNVRERTSRNLAGKFCGSTAVTDRGIPYSERAVCRRIRSHSHTCRARLFSTDLERNASISSKDALLSVERLPGTVEMFLVLLSAELVPLWSCLLAISTSFQRRPANTRQLPLADRRYSFVSISVFVRKTLVKEPNAILARPGFRAKRWSVRLAIIGVDPFIL